MALKALMLNAQIERKRSELEALREKDAEFERREADLETAISEAQTEEEEKVVTEQVEAFEAEKEQHESQKTNLQTEIEDLERQLAETESGPENPAETRERRRVGRERKVERMEARVNIRALPLGVRAFDAYPIEWRREVVEREDVKAFLTRLRDHKGSKRAVTGGDLEIPVVFLELISENMYRYSKLLNRVRVRPVPGQARQTIAGTVPEAVWTEMCGAINELNFVFNQVTLDGFKVAGFVPVCNSLLEDTASNLDLASWIVEMISESIGYAEDKAILYGKGASSHMPTGIVTRLAQTSQPDGYPANAPAWVDLHETNIIKIDSSSMTPVEFFSAFVLAAGNTYSRYARGRKFWVMNSKTYAAIQAKLITFTANGDLVSRLAGVMPITDGDVDVLEFVPEGDIIGGYGELYLWADRGAMQIDLSEHVQFIQDNTVFRGKARADGAPIIPQSFVAININNAAVTTEMDFAADNANDADLTALSVGGNSLSPAFDPDTLSYSIASATAATAKVEATAAQASASIAIAYNGANVRNGGTVTLLADGQPHPLTVTVKNGNKVKVYTVNITKSGD